MLVLDTVQNRIKYGPAKGSTFINQPILAQVRFPALVGYQQPVITRFVNPLTGRLALLVRFNVDGIRPINGRAHKLSSLVSIGFDNGLWINYGTILPDQNHYLYAVINGVTPGQCGILRVGDFTGDFDFPVAWDATISGFSRTANASTWWINGGLSVGTDGRLCI
jgi:hypothetical protein